MCLVPLTGKIDNLQIHKQPKRKLINFYCRLPLDALCLNLTHTLHPEETCPLGRLRKQVKPICCWYFCLGCSDLLMDSTISNLINSSQCCLTFDMCPGSAAVTRASWHFPKNCHIEQEVSGPAGTDWLENMQAGQRFLSAPTAPGINEMACLLAFQLSYHAKIPLFKD